MDAQIIVIGSNGYGEPLFQVKGKARVLVGVHRQVEENSWWVSESPKKDTPLHKFRHMEEVLEFADVA